MHQSRRGTAQAASRQPRWRGSHGTRKRRRRGVARDDRAEGHNVSPHHARGPVWPLGGVRAGVRLMAGARDAAANGARRAKAHVSPRRRGPAAPSQAGAALLMQAGAHPLAIGPRRSVICLSPPSPRRGPSSKKACSGRRPPAFSLCLSSQSPFATPHLSLACDFVIRLPERLLPRWIPFPCPPHPHTHITPADACGHTLSLSWLGFARRCCWPPPFFFRRTIPEGDHRPASGSPQPCPRIGTGLFLCRPNPAPSPGSSFPFFPFFLRPLTIGR